jgi:hypothetical protein
MKRNQKAFASIIILLFILFFLFITINNKNQNITDFIIIKQVNTQKETTYLNFETILNNTLNGCEDNVVLIKENILKNSYDYTNKNNFFIQNTVTKKINKINLTSFNKIIKVIVYKPTKNIIIKEIHLTNGILRNQKLGFNITSRRYSEIFLFPENYFLRKVIFC